MLRHELRAHPDRRADAGHRRLRDGVAHQDARALAPHPDHLPHRHLQGRGARLRRLRARRRRLPLQAVRSADPAQQGVGVRRAVAARRAAQGARGASCASSSASGSSASRRRAMRRSSRRCRSACWRCGRRASRSSATRCGGCTPGSMSSATRTRGWELVHADERLTVRADWHEARARAVVARARGTSRARARRRVSLAPRARGAAAR